MTGTEPSSQDDDDGASQLRSVAALAFILVFVAALVWTVNAFRQSNRTIECIESGRHECVPLDTAVKGRSGP